MEQIEMATDASLDPKTKAAGWAYWIHTSHGNLCHSGVVYSEISDITQCELIAVHRGLQTLSQIKLPQEYRVILYIDNQMAIRLLGESPPSMKRLARNNSELINNCQKLILQHKHLQIRHVKAHVAVTDQSESRYQMHQWCDRNSRLRMREQMERKESSGLLPKSIDN